MSDPGHVSFNGVRMIRKDGQLHIHCPFSSKHVSLMHLLVENQDDAGSVIAVNPKGRIDAPLIFHTQEEPADE